MSDVDFSKAKRGALISEPGKERITIRIDAATLARFRAQVKGGGNYQTLIHDVLKARTSGWSVPCARSSGRNCTPRISG